MGIRVKQKAQTLTVPWSRICVEKLTFGGKTAIEYMFNVQKGRSFNGKPVTRKTSDQLPFQIFPKNGSWLLLC